MVNFSRNSKSESAMTIVEVIVTSVLLGVVFTGMMATTTMTMKRVAGAAQKENDEKQLDRFQVEMTYFLSRSSKVEIQDASGAPAQEGNALVCTLQYDPLEQTPITSVKFALTDSPHEAGKKTLSVTVITGQTNAAPAYTYSKDLESLGSQSMFRWNDKGFVEYRWNLDSGYGIESFNNMAAPPASL